MLGVTYHSFERVHKAIESVFTLKEQPLKCDFQGDSHEVACSNLYPCINAPHLNMIIALTVTASVHK